MRIFIFLSALLAIFRTAEIRAAADAGGAVATSAVVVPEVGAKTIPSAFSDAQVAYVLAWIREQAPDCPAEAAAAAAEKFLGNLQLQNPAMLDRLPGPEFPARVFTSDLLRAVGTQLAGPQLAAAREAAARRRVAALLQAQNERSPVPPRTADEALARIKGMPPMNYRRLLEGRTEDDELLRLCQPPREAGAKPAVAAIKPKVLTAEEIVAEFSRRNQAGVATAARLRAYAVEARVTTVKGEAQEVLLYRLRPGRFRMVVRSGGVSQLVTGFDGEHYWRKLPGQAARVVSAAEFGELRRLGEFLDPLFEGEGCSFQRLEDGSTDGRKFFRIAVKRADGTGYADQVDQATYHLVGQENPDGSLTRYSEIRDFAGLMMARREETTYPDGRKGAVEITRMTANPGLVAAFFTPPAEGELDFFSLERLLAAAPAATGGSPAKANP